MYSFVKFVLSFLILLCCACSTGSAFELRPENLYASRGNSNTIDEYAPDGTFLDALMLPGVEGVRGIAFGPDHLLYAVTTESNNFSSFTVLAINHFGAVEKTYSGEGLLQTNLVYGKLAFASNGQFFVASAYGLVAFTPGQASSITLPGLDGLFDVKGLPNGNLLCATGEDIREVTTSGVAVRTITPSVRLDHASSLEYDSLTNAIFITDLGQFVTQLRRLDGSTGMVTAQASFNVGTDSVLTTDRRLLIASRFDAPTLFDLDLKVIGALNHGQEDFVAEAQFSDPPTIPATTPVPINYVWTLAIVAMLVMVAAFFRGNGGSDLPGSLRTL